MRARATRPELDLVREIDLGGSRSLRLHLDPRRTLDGYAGTGYKGVSDDYWHTGYKKLRPYAVSYDGKYVGRFATVEQAAVYYACVDLGMPPLAVDDETINSTIPLERTA